MYIPTNHLHFILQAFASAIAADGSESILAASILLLAAAAVVFTTLTVGLASIWCINKSIVSIFAVLRCLLNLLPALLSFVGSSSFSILRSSWHIVDVKAAFVATVFMLTLPPTEFAATDTVFYIMTCIIVIWFISKLIICGLGSLLFVGSCFCSVAIWCIVAAVCGIIVVAKVLRATLIFVGSFFCSVAIWCTVAAVCGIIGVAKVLRATVIFVGSCFVGIFKSSSQAIAVAMSNVRCGFAYILPAVIEHVGSCWTGVRFPLDPWVRG